MSNYLVVAAFTGTDGKLRTKTQITHGCSSIRTAIAQAVGRITGKRVNETIHKSALFYAVRLDAAALAIETQKLGGRKGHRTQEKTFQAGEITNLYAEIQDTAAKNRKAEQENAAGLLRDLTRNQSETDAAKTAEILKEGTNGVHQ